MWLRLELDSFSCDVEQRALFLNFNDSFGLADDDDKSGGGIVFLIKLSMFLEVLLETCMLMTVLENGSDSFSLRLLLTLIAFGVDDLGMVFFGVLAKSTLKVIDLFD